MKVYHVAGYVKLAKLWERTKNNAIAYHNKYYSDKFKDDPEMELVGVYIDITGQKNIKRRPQMVRLIRECIAGRVDCIATQTRAYLAANNEEFFYLLYLLFGLNPSIHIVTEDDNYHIDTIRDEDNQTAALKKMVSDYVQIKQEDYNAWKTEVLQADYDK